MKPLFEATWKEFEGRRVTRQVARQLYNQGRTAAFKESYCGNQRPERLVFCQLKKDHPGSCQAVIYWENEE